MRVDQKLTPKYWVGHNKLTDDVLISTARKSHHHACVAMENEYGDDWVIDENLAIILVEIRMVDLE